MLKIKVASIVIIQPIGHIYTFYGFNMKLDDNERQFIKKMANIIVDADLAHELTRIRYETGIRDRVTIDQVRKARYKMGITKRKGRGKCQIKKETGNE